MNSQGPNHFFLFSLLVIGLFLTASFNPALAEDSPSECKEFRLDRAGGSMESIPVWDQADTSICYAITAADLLDAYRLAHTPKQAKPNFTSPMAAAILGCTGAGCDDPVVRGSDGYDYLPFEGGDTCDVANYLRQHEACSRDAFDKSFGPEVEASLWRPAKQYALYQSNPIESVVKNAVDALHQEGFSIPPGDSIKEVSQAMSGTIWGYFKYLTRLACENEESIPAKTPPCREVITSDSSRFLRAVHAHFDQSLDQGQPMEVSYCSDIFSKGKSFAGIIPNNGTKPLVKSELCVGNDPNFPTDEGGHSSLLIGRRFNTETHKCQLLIKNSWGKDLSGISSDWETEAGKIWVDEDAFARNILGFSFLGDI